MSTTHIAGPYICFEGRTIQRCMLCGHKLVDDKNTAVPVNPDGTVDKTPTWAIDSLVRITEGNPTSYVLIQPEHEGKAPDDICIHLVED